jgi:hypothetical protein
MYPPLSEVGFRLRSTGSARMPQLIATTRRTDQGQSRDYLMPPPAAAAGAPPTNAAAGAADRERLSRVGRGGR